MPYDIMMDSPTLRVLDLKKELSFYQNVFGFQINRTYRSDDDLETVDLGPRDKSGNPKTLLILKHDPDATNPSHNSAGLYHFAILVPDRKSLAYAYSAIIGKGVNFDGFGDHLVSESLYLHDPEHNGIEIYSDRPQNQWQYDEKGNFVIKTLPLDLESILSELGNDSKIDAAFPSGTKIGHMHLKVTNLEDSSKFYQKLGFSMTGDASLMGVNFLAAGSYHHHLGLNTWSSFNGQSHVHGDAGLDVYAILVEDNSIVDKMSHTLQDYVLSRGQNSLLLSDPNGLRILVKTQN